MRDRIVILLILIGSFESCRKDVKEGEKVIDISITSLKDNRPIDSVLCKVEYLKFLATDLLSSALTDQNGSCQLKFHYDYSIISPYMFRLTEYTSHSDSSDPIVTYSGSINNHKIYRLDAGMPVLDFAGKDNFTVNLNLAPAAELKINCTSYGRLIGDSIFIAIYENKLLKKSYRIANNQYFNYNFTYFINTLVDTKLTYSVKRNFNEIIKNENIITMVDFGLDSIKIK